MDGGKLAWTRVIVLAALSQPACWTMQELQAGRPDDDTDADDDGDTDVSADADGDVDTDTGSDSEYLPEMAGKLTSIWGAAEDDIWAGGFDGTLLHFDGEGWELVPTHASACVRGIHGSAANDVWVVGYGKCADPWCGPDPGVGSHLMRFDGSQWSNPYPLSDDWPINFAAVYARSVDEAFFILNSYVLIEPATAPALCRLDGLEIECESFSSLCGWFNGYFQSIAGAQEGTLFVVGNLIARFDGTTWSCDSTGGANDVWALSQEQAFAVGGNGVVRRYSGGSTWAFMTTPTDVDLRGVWGIAPDDVFAVGENAIVHYDGASWTEMILPTIDNLRLTEVWGTAGDNVYAVGGHGPEHEYGWQGAVILRYDGSVWTVSHLVIE